MASPIVYENFRPSLPEMLYLEIVQFVGTGFPNQQPPLPHAVDIGSEYSKFISGLSQHFKQVTGIVTSSDQINDLPYLDKTNNNITYRLGSYDSVPLEDGCCDLVSSFMAAHRFESRQKLFAEAGRLLRPGGSLVVGGYGRPFLHYGNGRMDDELLVIQKEFLDEPLIKQYWTEGDKEVEKIYEGWELPYDEEFYRNEDLNISKEMTLTEYMNYIRSEHYCQKVRKNHPDETDPVDTYQKYVHETTDPKASPDDIKLHVMWRIFYLIGRKPL